jgi:hypothetical protein
VGRKGRKNETQRPTDSGGRNGNVNGTIGEGGGEGGWVPAFFFCKFKRFYWIKIQKKKKGR